MENACLTIKQSNKKAMVRDYASDYLNTWNFKVLMASNPTLAQEKS